jgi:hypothetical protein
MQSFERRRMGIAECPDVEQINSVDELITLACSTDSPEPPDLALANPFRAHRDNRLMSLSSLVGVSDA